MVADTSIDVFVSLDCKLTRLFVGIKDLSYLILSILIGFSFHYTNINQTVGMTALNSMMVYKN